MKKGLLSIGLVLITILSWGQPERYIEVTGSAEREVTPDVIVISIRLKEYDENKVKVTLDKIENDFLNAVTKSKISKENIELSDLTLNAVHQKRKERDFYSQKTYQISFSKTEGVLELLENLKDVKLDFLAIVKLSHTEIEKYQLELKIEALKAARKKAEALLISVGGKLGKPLIINENPEFTSWTPPNMYANASYNSFSANADGDFEASGVSEIPLKKIKLRFEILARFEIE